MPKKGENIYKRKDGRWEARYIKGYTPEKKALYGYCYGKTYKEAREKSYIAKASLFVAVPTSPMPPAKIFSGYCDEWLKIKRSGIKETTYVKYFSILENHIKPAFGKYPIKDISSITIEKFSRQLIYDKNLSSKTVRDILTIVHSIFAYISRHSFSMQHIEMEYPKCRRKEIRILNKDEQKCLFRYLLSDLDAYKFGVLIALMTGMRIGEICALRWSDIDLAACIIHVRYTMQRIKDIHNDSGKKTKIVITEPKSETSVRDIPLTEYSASFFRNLYRDDPAAFVLTGESTKYIEPRILQDKLKKYTKECNLEGVHFHTLRHTFATRCVEADFEIKSLSEVLGHSSPTITLQRYVHSSIEFKRTNMNKLSFDIC